MSTAALQHIFPLLLKERGTQAGSMGTSNADIQIMYFHSFNLDMFEVQFLAEMDSEVVK